MIFVVKRVLHFQIELAFTGLDVICWMQMSALERIEVCLTTHQTDSDLKNVCFLHV